MHFFTPLPPGLCKFYLCEVHFEFLLAAAGGELWSSCKRETDWEQTEELESFLLLTWHQCRWWSAREMTQKLY